MSSTLSYMPEQDYAEDASQSVAASHVTPGNKVGILRRRFGLGQGVIADLLHVTRSTVSAYENRQNASPSSQAITRLAGYFGIDPAWFYDGADSALLFIEDPTTAPYWSSTGNISLLERLGFQKRRIDFNFVHYLRVDLDHVREAKDPQDVAYKLIGELPRNSREFSDPDPHAELAAVNAYGWSLAPRISAASFVLFRKDPYPPSDSIVLVQSDKGLFYMKRLIVEGGHGARIAGLLEYGSESALKLGSEWTIWGGATKIIHPYKPGQANVESNEGQMLRGDIGFQTEF